MLFLINKKNIGSKKIIFLHLPIPSSPLLSHTTLLLPPPAIVILIPSPKALKSQMIGALPSITKSS